MQKSILHPNLGQLIDVVIPRIVGVGIPYKLRKIGFNRLRCVQALVYNFLHILNNLYYIQLMQELSLDHFFILLVLSKLTVDYYQEYTEATK